jgi:peptidoglycan biosynthesis protein MviN/MurJ (putative lipid II flippase)
MQLNLIPISLRTYITFYLLSGLGAGVITSLNYGQQISFIPEMLLTTQIIAVTGIKFNELSSKDDKPELNRFFISLLNILMLLMLPIGVLLALNSNEIVVILFTFAKKLDAGMLNQLALCIFFLSLTLPARALDLVMTRLITAQQKIKEGVVYAVIMHTAITAFVFIGITVYGFKGYLIANFLSYLFFLPVLYYFLVKKSIPFIQYGTWLINTLKFVGFNVLLISVLLFLKMYVLESFNPILKIISISSLYSLAVLYYNYITEYVPINNTLKKIFFKK